MYPRTRQIAPGQTFESFDSSFLKPVERKGYSPGPLKPEALIAKRLARKRETRCTSRLGTLTLDP